MHFLLWITTLDSCGFCFWLIKMMLLMSFQSFVEKFRIKKVLLILHKN